MRRKGFWRWHWMPITGLLMGLLSTILFVWINHISERHRINSLLFDAVMEARIRVFSFHLWLEEAVGGDATVEVKKLLAEIDQAMNLGNAVLNGGESGRGPIPALKDPVLRSQAETIKSLLVELKTVGLERLQNPGKSGIGTAVDQQFDDVFEEILVRTAALEGSIEKNSIKDHVQARRLFISILLAWVLIVIAAAGGIWSHEKRRRIAEAALEKSNEQLLSQTEELRGHREHLEELVDKRTRELRAANEYLRLEIAERRQTETALRESEKQLRSFSALIMNAQETERRRISRELHDELGQALTLLKLRLKSVGREMQEQSELKGECEDIACYIDEIIDNVRRLSPAMLEDLGLTAALRRLFEDFNKHFDGAVALEIADIDHLFSEDARIMIYRILQEALTNLGKHARARNVCVTVRKKEDRVSFHIVDDGKGFNLPLYSMRDPALKGLGLATMEERVRMLGGLLEMRSQKGKGTQIAFTVPTRETGL